MKTKLEETIVIDISTAELRKSMGEILNRVEYGKSSFIVKRKGKAIGAIVPVELAQELEQLKEKRQSAKSKFLEMLEERKSLNEDVSEDELMEEAVREVRAVRNDRG